MVPAAIARAGCGRSIHASTRPAGCACPAGSTQPLWPAASHDRSRGCPDRITDLPVDVAAHPRFIRKKEDREIAAGRARGAQHRFRTLSRGFVIGTAIAAIAAGLVLDGIEDNPEQASDRLIRWPAIPWVRATLQKVQAFGLFSAAVCGGLPPLRG